MIKKHIKKLLKIKGFLRRQSNTDTAPLINPIFEAESNEFPSDDYTHEKNAQGLDPNFDFFEMR